jgi:hypothetical protein
MNVRRIAVIGETFASFGVSLLQKHCGRKVELGYYTVKEMGWATD